LSGIDLPPVEQQRFGAIQMKLAELGSKARKALPPELQPESVRALTDGMTGDDATATD